MVRKNDIVGDLEKLNDIIYDFYRGRKMISFSPNIAEKWALRKSQ
jgi:hypothetical protein